MSMNGGPPKAIEPFHIQKHWMASYQFRLGASYRLFPFLSLYAGGWYETGAIPDNYIGVDFMHFGRPFFTGGVGVHVWKLEVLAGVAGSPASTHAVTQS